MRSWRVDVISAVDYMDVKAETEEEAVQYVVDDLKYAEIRSLFSFHPAPAEPLRDWVDEARHD